jgi:phosphoglycerol transferase MdoB-like AlkP superfamily enzyme
MWTDYPVIKIVLGWMLAGFILFFLFKKIIRQNIISSIRHNHLRNGLGMLCITGIFSLGMRGSAGVFPIEKDDAAISVNSFINTITMNGIFSLKDACSDYVNYRITPDPNSSLSKFGYTDKRQAVEDAMQPPSLDTSFYDTTAHSSFLEKNPPHVVFFLMESMSNHYLDLHSESLNLLGELKNQMNSCVVFRNFTSSRNTTIHSLEDLIVNTPLTPLSQSTFINKPLASSVAKPFLEHGYETRFITGGKLGWRNIGRYVSSQYFNEVEGCAEIMKYVPNTTLFEWGAQDEFVFSRVNDILQKAKKPQFVFVLLISNHTPYQLPDRYKPFPLKLTDSIEKNLICDTNLALNHFKAYQYSNHQLGSFMKKIKSSAISNQTIVAAAGDHNTLALFNFPDENKLMRHGVPFILQIPAPYQPLDIDESRFGSHKDIFPTLINLSLSNARYFKAGNNLFGSSSDYYFSLNDYRHAFDKSGAVELASHPIGYKRMGNKLIPCSMQENPSNTILLKHAKGYSTLLELEIKKLLLN